KKELQAFQHNLQQKLGQTERAEDYGRAGSIQSIRTRIDQLLDRIGLLAADDITDEKYQIDEARRNIARNIHALFNVSLLRSALESFFLAKRSAERAVQSHLGRPEDARQLETILSNEKEVINRDDLGLIKMKVNQLNGLS